LQELATQTIECTHAAERALTHRSPQLQRIDACFDAECEHFGERGLNHVTRTVVHELCNRARTYRTDVQDLIANCVEHSPKTIEHGSFAADEEREFP
jgi:hypothetical protein